MTKINFERVPITSNINGILYSTMYYNLPAIMWSNRRMYIYKYDVLDLIELEYNEKEDLLTVYDFLHSPDNTRGIFNIGNIDTYYTGYFHSAGLGNKRFLFDVTTKLPVSYNDFQYTEHPKLITPYTALVLDKKDGGYITDNAAVIVYAATSAAKELNNGILATLNEAVNIIKPVKGVDPFGSAVMTVVASMYSDIDIEELFNNMKGISLEDRLKNTYGIVSFMDKTINEDIRKLSPRKFNEAIRKIIPENDFANRDFSGDEIYLSDILAWGLDGFIKTIKNPSKMVKIILDAEQQTIRSMYILKGAAFISPATIKDTHYFMELFDSDNVVLVMN